VFHDLPPWLWLCVELDVFNCHQHNPRLQGWQVFFTICPGSQRKNILRENGPIKLLGGAQDDFSRVAGDSFPVARI